MPNLQITDSLKTVSVTSDQGILFNQSQFVQMVSALDSIKESIHVTILTFSKNMDGGTTYSFHMETQEGKKLDEQITFPVSGGPTLYAVSTGDSWSDGEWALLDLVSGLCATLVDLFGVTAINCTWA